MRLAAIASLTAVVSLAACGGADLEAYERIHAELKPDRAVERVPCGRASTAMTCSYIAPGAPYDVREVALERLRDLKFGGWGGTLGDDPVVAWSMDGETKLTYTVANSGPPPGPADSNEWPDGGEWPDEWAAVTISIQADDYHRCAIDCVGR